MIVTKPENKPFKNEFAARMYGGRRYLNYTVVPHLEGFAIETDGVPKEKHIQKDQEDIPAVTTTDSGATVKKHKVTTPWKQASLIDVPEKYKDPNYVYRFVKDDKPGNVQKKIAEQWEIDTQVADRIRNECPELLCPTINDGKQIGKSLKIREMVLMKMPKETADSRSAYYENRNLLAQGAGQSYKEQNKTSYGNVVIKQEN